MKYKGHTFSKNPYANFYSTLRRRVDDYFETNNISKHANTEMVVKTIVLLTLFFGLLTLMLTGVITNQWAMFASWISMGLAAGGIGMGIMHDANHGSYSKNSKVNKYLGYTMNLIGGNSAVWQLQHNFLHHTYTNIEHADDDIHSPSFLRFSPHQKRYWIHRYQHIYIWFFYAISLVIWVTIKDYPQIFRYRKMGLIPDKKKFRSIVLQIIGWKLVYYSYIIVLPLLLLPVPASQVILYVLSMHVVAGLVLSMVFQTAHIMTDLDFPLPNDTGMIENNWAVHQLLTTTNYCPKNRVLTWFAGGLNFQVEHHLFTGICHVHYRHISKIVASTAKEFGLPYHSQETFWQALTKHIQMLSKLGHIDVIPNPNVIRTAA